MTRAFAVFQAGVLALSLASCGGGSEEDTARLQLFDKIELLFLYYDSALQNQDPKLVEVAAGDLYKLMRAHFARVVEGLSSKEEAVRARAAFALGFSRSRDAIGTLVQATQDPKPSVRANAVAALGLLSFKEVPDEPFKRLLEDREAQVRVGALFGLRHVLDDRDDRGLLPVILALLKDEAWEVRNEAVILLRRLRRAEAAEPIAAGPARDREALVRRNAAATLGEMGALARPVLPLLIEMLRDDAHAVVMEAWRALNRITGSDMDRSYATWRDWFEEEQRQHYICEEHTQVSQPVPGECPTCRRKLERVPLQPRRQAVSTTVYSCPDHPQVEVASPSQCGKPGCGKDLVSKKGSPPPYSCPDHPEVTTTSPAKCAKPGCGRDLVPKR